MPIIKSAIKRVRQQKKRRARNISVLRAVKLKTKAVSSDIKSKKTDQAKLIKAISEIDRAHKKGVLHKKTAARKKSRLTKAYNKISSKAYGVEKITKTKPIPKKTNHKSKPTAKKPASKTTKPKAKTASKSKKTQK